MKFSFGVVLLLALNIPAVAAPSVDETALRALDHELQVATWKNDVAWIDAHLSKDFVFINGRAHSLDRAGYLKESQPGPVSIEPFDSTDVSVRIHGDTAVVNGTVLQKYTADGQKVEAESRYTDVWIREQGTWKYMSGHASPIAVKKTPVTP